jgi:hypothetical protein
LSGFGWFSILFTGIKAKALYCFFEKCIPILQENKKMDKKRMKTILRKVENIE